jgi:hypothetical protein
LGVRNGSASVGEELFGFEGLGVTAVSVKSGKEDWPLLDNANARMRATVDLTLMTFGAAECALEVEVVLGQLEVVATGEEPWREREHDLTHGEQHGVRVAAVERRQRIEVVTALGAGPVFGLQKRPDGLHLFGVSPNLAQRIGDQTSAPLDTVTQAS